MKNTAQHAFDSKTMAPAPETNEISGEPFPLFSHYRGLSRNPYYPDHRILRKVAYTFFRSRNVF